jgi:hypothetical protein
MRFITSFAAAALLGAITPVAQAAEYQSFKHDGVTYNYRVINQGETQIIVGQSEVLGETKRFTLTLKNGKVRGLVNGQNVVFVATDAGTQSVQLASD